MSIANMVLRTVYIKPSVDDALRDEAFKRRTSKNDLIRQYIELGMEAKARQSKSAGVAVDRQTPAVKKAVPAKKRAGTAAGRAAARGR